MAKLTKAKREQLQELRNALLVLHQALLTYQRKIHEKRYGRVAASGVLFTLATSNRQFAWLRSLSELIVGLDAYLEVDQQTTKNTASLIRYTKQMLSLQKPTSQFEKLYFAAVQKDPEVLIAHHRVMSILNPKKK